MSRAAAPRSAITITAKKFNEDNLVLADKLFEPQAGGKMLSMRYNEDGKLYDILRVQTPSLRVGTVFDNQNPSKTEVVGYTVALNFDQLKPADMEGDVPADEEKTKASQRLFTSVMASCDAKVIEHIASRGLVKGKGGKAPTQEEIESKFTNTIHWPDNPDYTLGMRAKINCRDVAFDVRKVFICDQDMNDISYWKIDPETNRRVYIYESDFNSLSSEPVFNIDVLRTRCRILRAVLESNNAWIQQAYSCSWKVINLMVEVGEAASYGRSAWATDEETIPARTKRGHDGSAAASASAGAGMHSSADIDELLSDP